MTAIVLILTGTIYVDGEINDEEKKHFWRILHQFFPKERFGELTQSVVRGVLKHRLFRQANAFQICTESFSVAERLLLMSFGYQISTSDGEMHAKERRYLQKIGVLLALEARHLDVLERGFANLPIDDRASLREVRHWLDPVRFQALALVFVEAANFMEEHLPTLDADMDDDASPIGASARSSSRASAPVENPGELTLSAFREQRDRLRSLHQQLHDTLIELNNRALLPTPLVDDSRAFAERLQSSTFRIAVVGEFSKGKSTLLNALLGQDVQPVSTRPCSRTISILRYGRTPRLLCCYTDGTEAEISLAEYGDRATIPKAEALEGKTVQALLDNPIERLIYESPELTFCQNGVEIVDSPGLNEHPDRTAVTQKILEKTDAVIVMLSAMQLLTESEKELVRDIAAHVMSSHGETSASGLFAVVNFIDTLDEDEPEALEDLKQRTENFFLMGEVPFVPSADRLHYLSAKKALKAKKADRETDYRAGFDRFVRSLEQFLSRDRGSLQQVADAEAIHQLIQAAVSILENAQRENAKSAEELERNRQQAVELMGNVAGRSEKVHGEIDRLIETLDSELPECFNKWWKDQLFEKLAKKRQDWSCDKSPLFDRDRVVAYATKQFDTDFGELLRTWLQEEAMPKIIEPMLSGIEATIKHHINAIQAEIGDRQGGSYASSFDWAFSDLKFQAVDSGDGGAIGGLSGIALAAASIALPGILLPIIVGSIVGSFGLGSLLNMKDALFDSVFETCCTTLGESCQTLYDSLIAKVVECVEQQIEEFDNSIEKILAVSHVQLEQIDRNTNASEADRDRTRQFIAEQIRALQTMQQEIETLSD